MEADEIPITWRTMPMRQLISELHQGWSPKCAIEASLNETEWGVIKTTAIQHMLFQEEENKQLPMELEPRLDLELEDGDILITRAGPRVRAGVACLVRRVRKKLILCDKAYRFRAQLDAV